MTELNCAQGLRTLVDNYNQHRISLEEYRMQRKQILDQLDKEINGIIITADDSNHITEATAPSIFGKVMNLMKTKKEHD